MKIPKITNSKIEGNCNSKLNQISASIWRYGNKGEKNLNQNRNEQKAGRNKGTQENIEEKSITNQK